MSDPVMSLMQQEILQEFSNFGERLDLSRTDSTALSLNIAERMRRFMHVRKATVIERRQMRAQYYGIVVQSWLAHGRDAKLSVEEAIKHADAMVEMIYGKAGG
jgi:hypothetical protein